MQNDFNYEPSDEVNPYSMTHKMNLDDPLDLLME